MGRTSDGPRFYASKHAYFANLNGDRVRLCDGPKNRENDRLAREKYEEEVDARRVHKEGDRSPVWAILDAWLAWCRDRTDPPPVAASTLEINARFARSFIDLHGTMAWQELLPAHFDEWLTKNKQTGPRKGWDVGTRRLAMNTLRAACTWANTAGRLVKHNPLHMPGMEKLRSKKIIYKGKRLALTETEHRILLAHALRRTEKDWAYLLMLWYATGARPAELALARASEWDVSKQAIIIQPIEDNQGRFKLAHLGEARRVYLPDYTVPLMNALCQRRPEGLLFLNQEGGPFDKETVCGRMECSKIALNKKGSVVRDGVTAYSYRHQFVTRWIISGGDPMKLCELLGTSLKMITTHYSHLFESHTVLRDSLNSFSGADPQSSPSSESPDEDEDEDWPQPSARALARADFHFSG